MEKENDSQDENSMIYTRRRSTAFRKGNYTAIRGGGDDDRREENV
jgi:hypothetical protein